MIIALLNHHMTRLPLQAACTLVLLLATSLTQASPIPFEMKLVDANHVLDPSEIDLFKKNLAGALIEWGKYVEAKGALKIRVEVSEWVEDGRMGQIQTLSPLSVVDPSNPCIVQNGAAYKLITDRSADAKEDDVVIRVNPVYLRQYLWMDPHPETRVDLQPSNRLDLVSVLMHELFHPFGLSGFRGQDGSLESCRQSAFDQYVHSETGHQFSFNGPESVKVNRGLVQLTSTQPGQNIYHYGDRGDFSTFTREGIMNGSYLRVGRRYHFNSLDIAIMKDLGLIK